jgi:hypothetical protein
VRHTDNFGSRNFHPEWGYLAPAPRFLRSVRLVVITAAIAATASAGVVFALARQPVAEASVAMRTLVPAPDTPSAPLTSTLADTRNPSGHIAAPGAGHVAAVPKPQNAPAITAFEPAIVDVSRIASSQRIPRAAVVEAPRSTAAPPAARAAAKVAMAPVTAATAATRAPDKAMTSDKNIRHAAPRNATAPAARLRVASVQRGDPPKAHPPAYNETHDAAVANRDKTKRDDDSLLTKTMGVTDHVIAATQRAVSTIGVVPTWIGSIGNRLGG